jgi:hypothetical protein
MEVIGVSSTQHYEWYLGLHAIIGRSKSSTFSGIKSKIWAKINRWKEKFISHAGKEILIKAVLQAMPTYTMNVFFLPKGFTKDLNSLLARFWWGHKGKDKSVPWMKWSHMGVSKDRGGLGYRDLFAFNLALLVKQ